MSARAEGAAIVRAHDLRRAFPEPPGPPVEAVRQATFELRPGEIVLVQGPSGSGKTTLLSMVGGIVAPDEGTLEVCGTDLRRLGEAGLPAFRLCHVGLVFQSFHLLDALTASENVELPLCLAGRRGSEARDRSRTLLDELGVGHRADAWPGALSSGERQRVAVARALALDPPLVLADEPTGSLDGPTGRSVMELLTSAARSRAASVMIVSHDDRLQSLADRVLHMTDGRLHS